MSRRGSSDARSSDGRSVGAGGPDGAPDDVAHLLPVVARQLHRLAAARLRSDGADILLEPAALVNETWLRLASRDPASWRDPAHFLAVAATAMRQILIDHARQRRTLKRGFGRARVTFEVADRDGTASFEVREVDEALKRLRHLDPRAAQVVELRFFTGRSNAEIAGALGVSRKTVALDWARARRWLAQELGSDHDRRRG